MNERSQSLPSDGIEVLERAGRYARQHGSPSVLAEHLLLGLLDLPNSAGARIIAALVPSVADLRAAVSAVLGTRASSEGREPSSVGSGQRVLTAAMALRTDSLGKVGSHHIALALIADEGTAGTLLRALGATSDAAESLLRLLERGGTIPPLHRPRDFARFRAAFDSALLALADEQQRERGASNAALATYLAVRAATLARLLADLPIDGVDFYIALVARLAPTKPEFVADGAAATRRPATRQFEQFSQHARHVLALAQDEARRRGRDRIGTEHLLLALLEQPVSTAARMLRVLGSEPESMRTAVERAIRDDAAEIIDEPGLEPRAQRVIALAVEEARGDGSVQIGTEHLLLGLLREGGGVAAHVLASLDITVERVDTGLEQAKEQRRRADATRRMLRAARDRWREREFGTAQPEQPNAGQRQTRDPTIALPSIGPEWLRPPGGVQDAAASAASAPEERSALALTRATVAALDALHGAQRAARAAGQRDYVAGLREIEAQMRALLDRLATSSADTSRAGQDPDRIDEPPAAPSYEELALRLLTQLQHAAAFDGRVRRAAALSLINQRLESLVFDLPSPSLMEVQRPQAHSEASLRAAAQSAGNWEATAIEEALSLLRMARALAAEHGYDATLRVLSEVIAGLRALPDDEDGGETAPGPAWPPPKPPFRTSAEQRLDA